DDAVYPQLLSIPVEADTILYGGAWIATKAAGDAVPASASTAPRLWGRGGRQVDNPTTAPGGPGPGPPGAALLNVRPPVYFFDNGTSTDALGASNVGGPTYASDDHTANATDGAGTRPYAGIMMPGGGTNNLSPTGQVAVFVGAPSPYFVPQGDALLGGQA